MVNMSHALVPSSEILTRYSKGDRDFDETVLAGADFASAQLEGAQFRGADLRGANLRGANLRGADLRMANLQGATLAEADLSAALMVNTDLFRADLQQARLMPRWLDGSFLVGADLSSTTIFTSFEDVVLGLGTRFHTTTLVFADLSKARFASQDEALSDYARRNKVDPMLIGRCDVDLATLNNTG